MENSTESSTELLEGPPSTPSRSSFIDNLTMASFMNKRTYQKYVEKTDPKKHAEHRDFLFKVKKHGSRILEITRAYLADPDKQVSIDMNRAFYEYAQSCIRHFDDEELQRNGDYGDYGDYGEAEHDDTLFDPVKTGDSIDSFFLPRNK